MIDTYRKYINICAFRKLASPQTFTCWSGTSKTQHTWANPEHMPRIVMLCTTPCWSRRRVASCQKTGFWARLPTEGFRGLILHRRGSGSRKTTTVQNLGKLLSNTPRIAVLCTTPDRFRRRLRLFFNARRVGMTRGNDSKSGQILSS